MSKVGVFIEDVTVEILPIKDELVAAIMYKQRLDEDYIRAVLKYNVIPIKAFALITGTTINNVHQKLRGTPNNNGEISYALNPCIPFKDMHEKFVYRNPKAQNFIEKKNNYESELESQQSEN